MGAVFKKTYTKPLPPGSEILVRGGKRIARWKDGNNRARTAALTKSKNGLDRLLVKSPYFVAKYRDGDGLVREVSTGCKDETAARRVLAEWERKAELVRSGVMTGAEDKVSRHRGTALTDHFNAFDEHLTAKGSSTIYRTCVAQRLRRLATECAFAALSDLSREPLERWLAGQAGKGMAAKSRNHYRNALVTFCNWCVSTSRLASNPVAVVGKANEKADRRRQRRALTEDELVRLLNVARERPLLEALTVRRGKRKGETNANVRPEVRARLELLGRERALIYKTFVLTGLRKGELAYLTVGQLSLETPIPFVTLNAAEEKNRQGSEVVFRADLAADLRSWLAGKLVTVQVEAKRQGRAIPARLPAHTRIFTVPTGLLRILDRDLVFAGIARLVEDPDGKKWIDKRDERGRTIDVHALRTTFGTLLSKGGVAPRTAQAAMRHSDIRLTMQVYTDPKLLDVNGALAALPELPLDSGRSATLETAAAGPDNDLRRSALAPPLAPTVDPSSQTVATGDKAYTDFRKALERDPLAVTSSSVNEKGPLTSPVSEPAEWALRDSNPRPHGCDPCALTN